MIPLRILGYNAVMRGPDGVHDLYVIAEDDGYTKSFTSRWEPTPAELAILNAGGSVELSVLHGQPPVKITAAERTES